MDSRYDVRYMERVLYRIYFYLRGQRKRGSQTIGKTEMREYGKEKLVLGVGRREKNKICLGEGDLEHR